jgi:pantetheine-phosphate adenylyltransferase
MSDKRVAVYAASFDPITNGHLDLIERAAKLFDEVVVAVATNVEKSGGTFPVDERIALIRDAVSGMTGVRVDTIEGLLVDYLRRIGARIVIRGLRALADFEYEFEMALMNSHMFPEIETVFLMTSERWFYVSASRVRELVKFGADISEFVPPEVAKRLRERIGPKKPR